MGQLSIVSIILVSFPEAIIVITLGILSIGKFNFLKIKGNLILLLLAATILSILSNFIRRYMNNDIEGLIASVFIISILSIVILRLKFYESIMVALFGIILLVIIEIPCLMSIIMVTKASINDIYSNDFKLVLYVMPERIIQIILIFISYKYKVKIINLDTPNTNKKEHIIQLITYLISVGTLIFLSSLMMKMLFFDRTNILNTSSGILLRMNIYICAFVIVILTLAIRSTNEHYKKKSRLSNHELLQSLEYITSLIKDKNYIEVENAMESLKSHIKKH